MLSKSLFGCARRLQQSPHPPMRHVASTWRAPFASRFHTHGLGRFLHRKHAAFVRSRQGGKADVRYWPKRTFRFHSITSSARCCMLNGTDRPSALAVFRLITISYFVADLNDRAS